MITRSVQLCCVAIVVQYLIVNYFGSKKQLFVIETIINVTGLILMIVFLKCWNKIVELST